MTLQAQPVPHLALAAHHLRLWFLPCHHQRYHTFPQAQPRVQTRQRKSMVYIFLSGVEAIHKVSKCCMRNGTDNY